MRVGATRAGASGASGNLDACVQRHAKTGRGRGRAASTATNRRTGAKRLVAEGFVTIRGPHGYVPCPVPALIPNALLQRVSLHFITVPCSANS